MEYRAVEGRCAIDIYKFNIPVSKEKVLRVLIDNGFKIININLIALARQYIGKSHYCRGANISEAPWIVDCSSFIKYIFGQYGIWLPRRTIQQRELGEAVSISEIVAGDLVFIPGKINYYYDNPIDKVGHVGIITSNNTVIHAANEKLGIIESPLEKFIDKKIPCVIKRYIPQDREIIVLEFSIEKGIETADDIKWIILQAI